MEVINWRELDSMDEDVELEILESYCAEAVRLCGEGGLAIEIGSYHGKSTAVIAQFFPHVLSIDLWGDLLDGALYPEKIGLDFPVFEAAMRSVNLVEKVHPTVSTSKVLEALLLKGGKINADFIFVDADHHFEPALLDLQRAAKCLSETGLIAVHDYKRPGFGYPFPNDPGALMYVPYDGWPGVAQAVDAFVAEGEFQIYDHQRGVALLNRQCAGCRL